MNEEQKRERYWRIIKYNLWTIAFVLAGAIIDDQGHSVIGFIVGTTGFMIFFWWVFDVLEKRENL